MKNEVTYISMLRGVNVGRGKRIDMNDLKDLYRSLGFHNTTTYIQSGNIIFQSPELENSILENWIAKGIKEKYAFDLPVLVLTKNELENVITDNPMPEADKTNIYVTFLDENPCIKPDIDGIITEINNIKGVSEKIFISSCAVYLYCPFGYSKTRLSNNFLEKKLNTTATTRNWRTVNKLYDIASLIENKNKKMKIDLKK